MEVFAPRSPDRPVVLKPGFEPIPLETIQNPPRPIPVRVFSLDKEPARVVAPQEALWVEAPGAGRVFWVGPGGRVEGRQKKDGLFLLLVPEGLPPGAYLVEAEGEQGKGSFEVVLDPGRPLFLVQFDPPRPAPNERVRVTVQPRTLVQEVVLRLPWGKALPLLREGERFVGDLLLPGSLESGKVVFLEVFAPRSTEGLAQGPAGAFSFRVGLRVK
ncbi:hypothetical protein [Thermus sp.]|uniref:hypothetical protein n=1 Tax=Thermus sp. TaxID=275 RepID=UPI00331D3A1B